MAITAGLSLPVLDRSLFGFRRTDRSVLSPEPDGQPSVTSEAVAPPELPPLGILSWNTSFANILDQFDVLPSLTVAKESTQSALAVTKVQASTTSSSEPQQQHDARLSSVMANVEFMTTGNYFSNLASHSSNAIPERQQSSTSSASLSKRSETFSIHSTSSKSSVGDVPEKTVPRLSLDPATIHPLNTDLFATGFSDTKLDLEFSSKYSSGIPSPTPYINKPLPPPPSAASRTSQANPFTIPIPELDSASITRVSKAKRVTHDDNSRSNNTKVRPTSNFRQSRSSQCLPSEDMDVLIPPRRNSARLRPRPEKSQKAFKNRLSVGVAEQVLLQILLKVDSISDLQAAALVNKEFYRAFRRHEPEIVEHVLWNASPAAWQLRQLVKREQKRNPFQMKAVQRDLAALRALQAFMLMRCDKLCRKRTLEGLMGNNSQRQAEIESALWRIWTFCKLFGKGTSRDTGTHAQIMWLEGNMPPEKGAKSGLQFQDGAKAVSKSELEDMSEIWRCMEMLLSGFRGRESEAREAGIFDQCKLGEQGDKTEAQYLEDWLSDILSVGPKAVLTMISCSFEHAKVLGVNKWTPPRQGRSRRSFLKAALEQVYRDRLVEEARHEAEDFAKSMHKKTVGKRRMSDTILTTKAVPESLPTVRRPPPEQPAGKTTQEKPKLQRLDIRPDCDPEATLPSSPYQIPTMSPTTNPAAFSSLAMMSNASTRLGATLFPHQQYTIPHIQECGISGREPNPEVSIDQNFEPKVVDPTDRALSLLVKQLGFPETLAKQALAMSDDGAGIDVQRAVELLSEDRRLEPTQKETRIAELPDNESRPLSGVQQFKDYCEGTCRRVSLVHRKRSNLRGLMNRNSSIRQSFPLGVIMDHDDEDSAVHQLVKQAIAPSVPISMPTLHEHLPESKGGFQNLAEFIKYRNNVRSQDSVKSPHGFFKGHKKSSSTGTVDFSKPETTRSLSPISPMTPATGLGGFIALRPQSQSLQANNDDQFLSVVPKPKVTLTRVGTGKRPSKRISFTKHGSSRPGEPPEIIGYAY